MKPDVCVYVHIKLFSLQSDILMQFTTTYPFSVDGHFLTIPNNATKNILAYASWDTCA